MECTTDIGGLIGSIFTVISLLLLSHQIRSQNKQLDLQHQQSKNQEKKDKVEIVMRLYSDFFNNQKFQNLFEIIDQDDFNQANQDFEKLLSGQQVEEIKEVNLSQYMNFFNSLAILAKEGVIEQDIVLQMFKYQLEKTFSYVAMIRYMENYGFDKIKYLLPDVIFTYGTLCDSDARKSIPEIKDCIQYLENNEVFNLVGYELVDVLADQVYKGLISSNTQNQVPGTLLKIVDKSIWYDLFSGLDTYEEVEALYDRKIIQLNDTKRYAWVYMKKLQ